MFLYPKVKNFLYQTKVKCKNKKRNILEICVDQLPIVYRKQEYMERFVIEWSFGKKKLIKWSPGKEK